MYYPRKTSTYSPSWLAARRTTGELNRLWGGAQFRIENAKDESEADKWREVQSRIEIELSLRP